MQKTESSYMKCIEVSVKPNELYSFDLQIGNDWIGIAFVDKSNNIIKSYIKQAKWKTYIDCRAKAPEGSVKALINSNKNGSIGASILTNRKYKYILPRYYRNHLDVKIDEINSAIAKDEGQDYYGVVNRVSGTTTDTAFDVICANVKKRSVTLIRVGAGSNRSWTY